METFKLRNIELHSVKIDVDADKRTLVSRDYADGVTFTEDPGTRRLRTTDGLCIHTGEGTNTKLWQLYSYLGSLWYHMRYTCK